MDSCCKLAFCPLLLLLLLLPGSNQDCFNDQKASKHKRIPFILPVSTDSGQCRGIIISRYYILTNAKCVNGSLATNIHVSSSRNRLAIANGNTDNIMLVPEKVILHEHFRKVHSTYYQNDLALLKLPSPLNFSLAFRPATFLSNDENTDKVIAAMVVWKAGQLTTTIGVIQKAESCVRVFGPDFNPSYHLCALISDDVFITHVDGSMSHPLLVNGSIVGFAIPYPILDKDGRMYRIMRVSSVVGWINKFTLINQDSEFVDDFYEEVEDCLFQNIDSNSYRNNSLTLHSILQQLVEEQIKDIKRETKTAIDSVQIKVAENVQVLNEFKSLWKTNLTELELNISNNINQEARRGIEERFVVIRKDIENTAKEIDNNIKQAYTAIQRTLSEKEEAIVKRVNDKYSEIQSLLQDKSKEINALAARLSLLEQATNSRN